MPAKLSWDDPVYQRLPGFVMYDPYVSHEMTIRDLLTHRSGMGPAAKAISCSGRHPLTHAKGNYLQAALHGKPASSFRSHYAAYDNLLYMTAGQIIPAVTKVSPGTTTFGSESSRRWG